MLAATCCAAAALTRKAIGGHTWHVMFVPDEFAGDTTGEHKNCSSRAIASGERRRTILQSLGQYQEI